MSDTPRLLVVDDEASIREALRAVLKGHDLDMADSAERALEMIQHKTYDLVIQDIKLPGMDGLQLLEKIKELSPQTVIVVTTAFSAWENATRALRAGAYDYIKKPFDNTDIRNAVERALKLKTKGTPTTSTWRLVGKSKVVQDVFTMVRRVAHTESTVLIQGESGTGKELVASALHTNSLRHTGPFVSVNCGAFTATLLESELFGHMKGSFTGADRTKKGLVEVADGGTFFLDEIGEMPLALQVKLLRLLEEKEFIPVGANKATKVDVRFVCATNRNLQEEVKKGNFREDLYYRLNVIPINLPALRERGDDILLLADFFIGHYGPKMRSKITGMSDKVKQIFLNYEWPGNVRELENTIQRALALASPDSTQIEFEDLEDRLRKLKVASDAPAQGFDIPDSGIDLHAHLDEIEKRYILKALEKSGNDKNAAARLLGVQVASLNYRIKKLGLGGR